MEEKIIILYEDADVVVINKPSGLVVHADGRTAEPSVVDWLGKNRPEIKGVGDLSMINGQLSDVPNKERPGIVHRLDRETSGALIIVKNQLTFLNIKKQFQSRAVTKIYHAFVYGEMKQDDGVIDRAIGKSRKNFRLYSAQRGARGTLRDAITEYEVLARALGFTFVALMPKTGRTHQIRAHLKAINYPVVCDKLYAPNRECALGFKRLALHALSLKFSLLNGKEIKVEAPYPKDFKHALKIFGV